MKFSKNSSGTMVRTWVLAAALCAIPLLSGPTGCTTGSRYKQSTGEVIDDHGLSSDVKSALGADTRFKYDDVNVVTFKGVVQLSGFVNNRDQKARAGELAGKVANVKEVQNNISIKE